ncbi:MAG: sensor histidine kinase [Myxococcota bacterium]|nr:sensor histidine kinase [Myxococcota bacterium]
MSVKVTDRPLDLAPPLLQRMAPLALLLMLLLAVVVPWFYSELQAANRRGEAEVWAQQLAHRWSQRAALAPELWAYQWDLLQRDAAPLVGEGASLSLSVPWRAEIFQLGTDTARAPLAVQPILLDGIKIGEISVSLPVWRISTPRSLLTLCLIVGLTLGALTLLLPYRTAREGDARSAELWRALSESHRALERRVEARTSELERLSERLLYIQEEERARISRDLHDELGQLLTGLRLQLSARSINDVQRGFALETVDLSIERVREIAHDLCPPALEQLGLASALQSLAEKWASQNQIKLSLSLDDLDRCPYPHRLAIFRLAQEGLTNITRHASAERAWVRLTRDEDALIFSLRDDGVGLKEAEGNSARGLGLVGAQARARRLGGRLALNHGREGGLELVLSLPLDEDLPPDSSRQG